MNDNKLALQSFVVDCNGVWKDDNFDNVILLHSGKKVYVNTYDASRHFCSREEFDAMVRELGIIPGTSFIFDRVYQYFHRSGEDVHKLGLRQDLMIQIKNDGSFKDVWSGPRTVGNTSFNEHLKYFKIVDERFAPLPKEFELTSYLSFWWDVRGQRAIRRPPVGTKIEWKGRTVFVVGHHICDKFFIVSETLTNGAPLFYATIEDQITFIDTDMENTVTAALTALTPNPEADVKTILRELYYLGFLSEPL